MSKVQDTFKKQILQVMYNCRVLPVSQLFAKIGEKVNLDKLEKEGLLEIKSKQDGRVTWNYLEITDAGLEFCKTDTDRKSYRGFVLEHDIELCRFFLDRSKEEQASWKTREQLLEEYKTKGSIDGAFINKFGKLEGIEVMSKKSRPEDMTRIEEYVRQTGIEKMNYILY